MYAILFWILVGISKDIYACIYYSCPTMNKYIFGLGLFVSFFLSLPLNAQSSTSPDSAPDMVRDMLELYEEHPAFHATFSTGQKLPGLSPERFDIEFWKSDDRFRIEYLNAAFLYNGESFWEVSDELQMVTKYKYMEKEMEIPGITLVSQWFKSGRYNFRILNGASQESDSDIRIEINPTEDSSDIRKAFLTLTNSQQSFVGLVISYPDGSVQDFWLNEFQPDTSIPEDVFSTASDDYPGYTYEEF